MRFAPHPRLLAAAPVAAASLCLFGFGFLAGLTHNAPWGLGPACACAVAALALAAPPLVWLRRRGREVAAGEGPAWLARIDPPLAYGIAVALAASSCALVLMSRSWSGTDLFWPACFGLASAGMTVFGDARARAEADLSADEADPEDDDGPDPADGPVGPAEGPAPGAILSPPPSATPLTA